MPFALHIIWLLAAGLSHFNYKEYEHWALKHHHKLFPITTFASVWSSNKQICGGAMSGLFFNGQDGEFLQVFQGCYISISPTIGDNFSINYDTPPIVHILPWIN